MLSPINTRKDTNLAENSLRLKSQFFSSEESLVFLRTVEEDLSL